MNKFLSVIFITSVFLCNSLNMAEAKKRLPPPDPGVSDEELVSLGTKAVPFLLTRLEAVENEKYFKGIINRLSVTALKSGPDDRIQDAFEIFVASHSQRENAPFKTMSAMRDALKAMSYTGDKAGVKYLIHWIKKGHKNVRCQDRMGRVEANASDSRDSAILGLGYSTDSKAKKFLQKLANEKNPKVPYKGSYKAAIRAALRINKKVKKVGVQDYLLPKLIPPSKTKEKQKKP